MHQFAIWRVSNGSIAPVHAHHEHGSFATTTGPGLRGHEGGSHIAVDNRRSEQFDTDFPYLTLENRLFETPKQSARSFIQKMFLQPHRTSVGRKERSCSSRQIRARCAVPRPLLRKLSRTLCTSSLRFTDTSATGADPSNRWLCFARRRFNR
jgi:hypothetical protein